jgi:hypothetical protein
MKILTWEYLMCGQPTISNNDFLWSILVMLSICGIVFFVISKNGATQNDPRYHGI